MLPDGENISTNDVQQQDQDPYLVPLVAAANNQKVRKYSESMAVIVDELQGTALRRRSQLLKSRY
ncbi:MAG: hypothetical protein GY727_14105 [Gammaproteobacteria bacterium]|nr:hypothetical protein [Gammaproteobacteria bacterium]MCP4091094.1 hypothetical protein [Gammaproteobacteria bacterium]MCP4277380.1 hypothetical protein [Gammaproteobacteria bacterium]MCP4831559.1 hypothetical protein [Gammaproteobacteria bacterium]MCP4927782.1 hypothetical protein [Gammaproteobacteria bacterium]